MAAVLAKTCDLQRCPHRISGEELVVGGNSRELDHAQLHDEVVNELLGLLLGDLSLGEISLDVDVEEGGDSAHAHRGAVLGLDGCQIPEVEPLDSLLGGRCGLGDVIAVALCHLLHALQGADLLGELFSLADHIIGHGAVAAVCKILSLLRDQVVDAVERNPAIVADDSASSVGVRKACHDVAVAGDAHLIGVGIKHRLVVGLMVLGEDLVELRIHLKAVGGGSLLRHLDAAIGHEGSL